MSQFQSMFDVDTDAMRTASFDSVFDNSEEAAKNFDSIFGAEEDDRLMEAVIGFREDGTALPDGTELHNNEVDDLGDDNTTPKNFGDGIFDDETDNAPKRDTSDITNVIDRTKGAEGTKDVTDVNCPKTGVQDGGQNKAAIDPEHIMDASARETQSAEKGYDFHQESFEQDIDDILAESDLDIEGTDDVLDLGDGVQDNGNADHLDDDQVEHLDDESEKETSKAASSYSESIDDLLGLSEESDTDLGDPDTCSNIDNDLGIPNDKDGNGGLPDKDPGEGEVKDANSKYQDDIEEMALDNDIDDFFFEAAESDKKDDDKKCDNKKKCEDKDDDKKSSKTDEDDDKKSSSKSDDDDKDDDFDIDDEEEDDSDSDDDEDEDDEDDSDDIDEDDLDENAFLDTDLQSFFEDTDSSNTQSDDNDEGEQSDTVAKQEQDNDSSSNTTGSGASSNVNEDYLFEDDAIEDELNDVVDDQDYRDGYESASDTYEGEEAPADDLDELAIFGDTDEFLSEAASFSFLPKFKQKPELKSLYNALSEAEELLDSDEKYDYRDKTKGEKFGKVALRILDILANVGTLASVAYIIIPFVGPIYAIVFWLIERLWSWAYRAGEEMVAQSYSQKCLHALKNQLSKAKDPKTKKAIQDTIDKIQKKQDNLEKSESVMFDDADEFFTEADEGGDDSEIDEAIDDDAIDTVEDNDESGEGSLDLDYDPSDDEIFDDVSE